MARSVFQVVFLAIIAQSCQPSLVAPQNGSIECGNQTVGETCTFYCDDGFTLRVPIVLASHPCSGQDGRQYVIHQCVQNLFLHQMDMCFFHVQENKETFAELIVLMVTKL